MGIARSTFYDLPTAVHDDTAIVEAIAAICDEFEFYGWRRVRAELRHRGMIVNHKKIRRLMRQHDLQPRQWRRYVATTDSDHDQPIYPNRARDLTIDGLNQLPPRTPLIVWTMPSALSTCLGVRPRRFSLGTTHAPGGAAANPIVGGCAIQMRPSLVTRLGACTRGPGGLAHFAASMPSAKPKVPTPNAATASGFAPSVPPSSRARLLARARQPADTRVPDYAFLLLAKHRARSGKLPS
jgi:hypothetical protein